MKALKSLEKVANKVKTLQAKVDGVGKKVKRVKQIIDHPLESGGSAVGRKLGSERVGRNIGKFVGRIAGTGDYTVASNSLYTHSQTLSSGNVPQFSNTGRGIRITHREYLGEIVASTTAGAFSITKYSINPGLFGSFPWFSGFASQFDEWRPNGIVAVVNSLSSSYSGTASLGSVMVATDYDVLDPPYASKVELANSEFATTGNTATSLIHPLECKTRERPLLNYYVRSGTVSSSDSLRFYDFANLYVATSGCAASQLVGELWLSFDITLYKPQLYGSILGRNILTCSAEGTTGITNAAPFSTNLTFTPDSSFTVATSLTDLTFPSSLTGGTFLVVMAWQGASTAFGPGGLSLANCQLGP